MTATTGPIRIEAPPLHYEPALDGIRAFAVLSVMVFHFGGEQYLPGGILGVDWFFVLSGFLITNLLLDERNRDGAISLRGFYHRRILRLFPAMYAFLGFVLVVSPFIRDEVPDIWTEILAASLYSYQLLIGFFGFGTEESPRLLLHVWTLSVEEWFYFFWPVLLVWGLARQRSQRALLAGCAAVIAFWMGLRLWAPFAGYDFSSAESLESAPYPLAVLLRFSAMRFDALVIGCLLAILRRRLLPLTPRARSWLSLAAGVGVALAMGALLLGGRVGFFDPFTGVGYNAALFGIGACVLWLHANQGSSPARLLSLPVVVWVGTRSYALYLWHEVPNALVPDATGGPSALVVRTLVVTAASFVLAELSWRLVESPFLRRKRRRYASTSPR